MGFDVSTDSAIMLGIAAGVMVFVVTITTVFCLLVKGGSFARMQQQAVSTLPPQPPQLHDSLLTAARSLPCVVAPFTIAGKRIHIRPVDTTNDAQQLLQAVPTSAGTSAGAPDVTSRWWALRQYGPFRSATAFADAMALGLVPAVTSASRIEPPTGHDATQQLLCVVHVPEADTDASVGAKPSATASKGRAVGIVQVGAHDPAHLRVRITDMWLASTLHGTPAAYEAVYLVLGHLFGKCYRRVEWSVDACDAAARELASKSGFTLEAIMRKHMIVKQRSRDSALYAVTNSEWEVLRPQLAAKAKLKGEGQSQGQDHNSNKKEKRA